LDLSRVFEVAEHVLCPGFFVPPLKVPQTYDFRRLSEQASKEKLKADIDGTQRMHISILSHTN
jgi:hypothetical protein